MNSTTVVMVIVTARASPRKATSRLRPVDLSRRRWTPGNAAITAVSTVAESAMTIPTPFACQLRSTLSKVVVAARRRDNP